MSRYLSTSNAPERGISPSPFSEDDDWDTEADFVNKRTIEGEDVDRPAIATEKTVVKSSSAVVDGDGDDSDDDEDFFAKLNKNKNKSEEPAPKSKDVPVYSVQDEEEKEEEEEEPASTISFMIIEDDDGDSEYRKRETENDISDSDQDKDKEQQETSDDRAEDLIQRTEQVLKSASASRPVSQSFSRPKRRGTTKRASTRITVRGADRTESSDGKKPFTSPDDIPERPEGSGGDIGEELINGMPKRSLTATGAGVPQFRLPSLQGGESASSRLSRRMEPQSQQVEKDEGEDDDPSLPPWMIERKRMMERKKKEKEKEKEAAPISVSVSSTTYKSSPLALSSSSSKKEEEEKEEAARPTPAPAPAQSQASPKQAVSTSSAPAPAPSVQFKAKKAAPAGGGAAAAAPPSRSAAQAHTHSGAASIKCHHSWIECPCCNGRFCVLCREKEKEKGTVHVATTPTPVTVTVKPTTPVYVPKPEPKPEPKPVVKVSPNVVKPTIPPKAAPAEEPEDEPAVIYSYEKLKSRPAGLGIDLTKLETYLAAGEFEQVFGMSRAKFNAMPQWKRLNAKKKADLF